MMFCPKCGSIMVPKKDRKRMSCSCGYSSKQKENVIVKEQVRLDKTEKIEVVDKKIEPHPKTDEECPKCHHKKAFYWTVQTRAGDEAETRFFECTKCRYRWRSYS